MIESKFTFFKVQVEGALMDPSETDETSFCIPPEAFDPIHMRAAADKLIFAMIDAEMFPIPDIDQPIVPAPSVRINDAIQGDLPSNAPLQRGFSAIRDEFRVDVPIALENPKDDGFSIRPAAPFAFDAPRANVGFIDFDLAAKGRLCFTKFCDAFSKTSHIPIDRIAIQSG